MLRVKRTPQGDGASCLSAPESYRLNWATAIASLDANSLVAGKPVAYDIPALHTTPANLVLVKTDVSGVEALSLHRWCLNLAADELAGSLAPSLALRSGLTPTSTTSTSACESR